MARYSQRVGPPAGFQLPLANTLIPGLSITRSFDDGELLLLLHSHIVNAGAGPLTANLSIRVDGVIPAGGISSTTAPAAGRARHAAALLVPIAAGLHTIEAVAAGNNDPNETIPTNAATLTAIQLPLWDSDADIT